MATTPGRKLRVYVGGTRTVRTEPAKWVEHVMEQIGQQGRDREDGTTFIKGVGWRLTDAHTFADRVFERGEAATNLISPRNSTALLAAYSDTGATVTERPFQRWPSELGTPQGSQTTQGSYRVVKMVGQLTGFGSDVTNYPPPDTGETVPLDRVLVGSAPLNADDEIVASFSLLGSGGSVLDSIYRLLFPSIAGTSKTDVQQGRRGTGQYALLFLGNGLALLHERRDDSSWVYRKTMRYCGERDVVGYDHFIRIRSDVVRDGTGHLFGKTISFGFGESFDANARGGPNNISNIVVGAVEAPTIQMNTVQYRVPAPIADLPSVAQTPVRIDARRDCRVSMEAWRTTFEQTGTLYCNTITLAQPTHGGVVHVQVFGSFPAGTTTTATLYGATTGTVCAVASTPVNSLVAKFTDFTAIEGETSYVLNVSLQSTTDRLKSPTIKRIRYIREATFATIPDADVEILNVTEVTTTGAGSDPSTESLGLVCYDYTGVQNAILTEHGGQWIRVEAELGPDPNDASKKITTVLFRGIVREARRQVRGGANAQQAGGAPLRLGRFTRIVVKAVSEYDWLMRHLAPGQLDITFDGTPTTLSAGQPQTYKVTDLVRQLLVAAVGAARVDVPDLPVRLPLDQDFPSRIEVYQPIVPLALEFIQKYLGGWLVKDHNASNGTDASDKQGIWRVRIAPKRSAFLRLAEFWTTPALSSTADGDAIDPVDPGAYPTLMEGGRPIVRTFLRYGTDDAYRQPPQYSQIVVRGVVAVERTSALMLGTVGGCAVVLNNYRMAQFSPTQAVPPDPTHPDYTTGDVVTLVHSDPMLNTQDAVVFVARRLYDMKCHAKDWVHGEAPLVVVTKDGTRDPKQIRPRPLLFGDIVTVKNAVVTVSGDGRGVVVSDGLFVVSESPSILVDGRLGGQSSMHGYYSMYSAPPDDSYRAAYGEPVT